MARACYVLCEGTDELAVADAHTGKITRPRAGRPRAEGLVAQRTYAYVANSWSDTVSVIDTSTLQVTRTLKTGFEPNAVFADAPAPPFTRPTASATTFR
jgi:YVTN family beta-propeller protein